MNVKDVPVADLIPYINNPRKNSAAVDFVAASIKEFGFKVPIVVDKNNVIVAGHTRLMAALKIGLTSVPCIVADDLTDAQIKAFRLADNKTAEFAEWDMDKLAIELEGIEEIDMEEFGFEAPTRAGDVVEDDYPVELPPQPITKLGDIWQLGDHRVMCGDSTVVADVEKLMSGKQADLVVTDPPYNVNYGDKAEMLDEYEKGHRNTSKILNDNMSDAAFRKFLTDAFLSVFAVAKPGAAIYVFHSDSEGYNFRGALRDAGWNITQCLIWVKNVLVLGRQDYQWRHEPILYGWKPGAAHRWFGGRKQTTVIEDDDGVYVNKVGDGYQIAFNIGANPIVIRVPNYEIISYGDDMTTVWNVDKPTRNDEHPTMKPIKLCTKAIENGSKRGDIVIDTFGGSGSTMIACEQIGRACYMMELDPKYCDVIVERWEQFTGRKAVLINEGKETISV